MKGFIDMKNRIITLRSPLWLALFIPLFGILLFGPDAKGTLSSEELEEIDAVIDRFQEAYSAKSVEGLRQLFFAEAVIAYDFAEGTRQGVFRLEEWLQSTQEDVFNKNRRISDVLSDREIVVYQNIAYAVCTYNYRDDTKHHQGVDIFTFMKFRGRWKILSLQWTGNKVN